MVECPIFEKPFIRKKVSRGGNSGRVYLPKDWVGKEVVIILVEEGQKCYCPPRSK